MWTFLLPFAIAAASPVVVQQSSQQEVLGELEINGSSASKLHGRFLHITGMFGV